MSERPRFGEMSDLQGIDWPRLLSDRFYRAVIAEERARFRGQDPIFQVWHALGESADAQKAKGLGATPGSLG